MPTQVDELYIKNKNRTKRNGSAAAFSAQRVIPGGAILGNGNVVIGKLEANTCVTRVTLLVKEGFPGASIGVSDGSNAYLVAEDISAPVVVESALTANAAVRPDPVYSEGAIEFTATFGGFSGTDFAGELIVVIDYTQLDTVTGLHTK